MGTPPPRQPYTSIVHPPRRASNEPILGSLAGSSFEASAGGRRHCKVGWATAAPTRLRANHRLAPSQRPARHPAASWYFLLDVLFQERSKAGPSALPSSSPSYFFFLARSNTACLTSAATAIVSPAVPPCRSPRPLGRFIPGRRPPPRPL